MSNLPITEKYEKIVQSFKTGKRVADADRISMTEALSTPDYSMYFPTTIETIMVDAAEPEYLLSKFLRKITLKEGRSIEFINFGALRAFEVPEGTEIPMAVLDIAKQGAEAITEVRVKKYGLRVPITDEMIRDSQWDVVGMHLEAAGRAMARKQEEVIFYEFSKHGHIVFDTTESDSAFQPTGRGYDGTLNGTLTAEDFIDMCVSIMAAGFTPTDVVMHPLCYSLFLANQSLYGMFQGAPFIGGGVQPVQPEVGYPTGQMTLPVRGLQVHLSPRVPFNEISKVFDLYIIDRNNAGVIVEKDPMSVEQFDDPIRDIVSLKVTARYGVGKRLAA